MSNKWGEISKLIYRYFVIKANTQNTVVIKEYYRKPISDSLVFGNIFGEIPKRDVNICQKCAHNKSSS
jgi:hypothetical protein